VLGNTSLSEPRFHIAKAKEATQEASAKASELENTANQAKTLRLNALKFNRH
jgi:hypothetical protein